MAGRPIYARISHRKKTVPKRAENRNSVVKGPLMVVVISKYAEANKRISVAMVGMQSQGHAESVVLLQAG